MEFRLICSLIHLFLLFSCLGWCMEVILKYIQYHRFINRGFLIGPYCPIYGYGALTITLLVGGLIGRQGTIGETFLAGVLICGVLEYFTSWYMEKMFHARWWDYSQKPMNLNGRIWIGNLILFGLGSIVIIWVVDPLFFSWIDKLPSVGLYVSSMIIVVLFLADNVVSHIMMNLVKKEIDQGEGDNTEEISRQIHEILKNKQVLMRRIHQAYPKLQARPQVMVQEFREAREKFRKAQKQSRNLLRMFNRVKIKRNQQNRVLEERLRRQLNEAVELQHKARKELLEIEKKLFSHHRDDWF